MIQQLALRFPWLVDQVNSIRLLMDLRKSFRSDSNPWKTPTTSRDYYDAYGDKEQQDYLSGKLVMCREGNINRMVSYPEFTLIYLAPVFEQIDELLKSQKSVSVLEIGCGNCINLVELKKRYGDAIVLSGLDVSPGRIKTALAHFSQQLAGTEVWVESAIEPVKPADFSRFDLVFSIHCLEQIPYAVTQAVQGMWQRARKRVVLVEPVWEFARPVQKLKLVRSDYIRTLLPTVRYLGYNILIAKPLGFESSQKNQSSVIVVDKKVS